MDQVIAVVLFALSVLAGLLILTFLVVIHEFGHAIAARRNGVEVEEFGIGFPPRAWGKKLKNGVVFSLNWLPIGGFVKLKGEHDEATAEGSYGGANLWAKTKILLAGVVINWVAAAILFAIVALVGVPKMLPNQFSVQGDTTETKSAVIAATVVKGSPAEKAGLQGGDEITKLAGVGIKTPDDLTAATKQHAGQTVALTFNHDKQSKTVDVALNSANNAQHGYLGVGPTQDITLRSTWSAPIVGVGLTGQFTYETVKGIGVLLGQVGQGVASKFSADKAVQQSGNDALSQANKGVAGPIGIVFNIFPTFLHAGIVPLLLLTAIISLTLAVMNVLPIPALDGGRLYLTLIFHAIKKPLTKEREEKIVGYSFYALILLVIFISLLDVGKLFHK